MADIIFPAERKKAIDNLKKKYTDPDTGAKYTEDAAIALLDKHPQLIAYLSYIPYDSKSSFDLQSALNTIKNAKEELAKRGQLSKSEIDSELRLDLPMIKAISEGKLSPLEQRIQQIKKQYPGQTIEYLATVELVKRKTLNTVDILKERRQPRSVLIDVINGWYSPLENEIRIAKARFFADPTSEHNSLLPEDKEKYASYIKKWEKEKAEQNPDNPGLGKY